MSHCRSAQGAANRSNAVMTNPQHAARKVLCGPVQVYALVKVSYILTTCPCFDNLEFDILDVHVRSATLSRLLPLQLEFERFQYISLKYI